MPQNTLSRQYNTTQPAYIWKYFEILSVKGQDNIQNTSVNVNSYRSCRQPSKLEKNNRQPSKLPPRLVTPGRVNDCRIEEPLFSGFALLSW